MAYHDEKGRITIDEVAAGRDISRLQQSAEILKESREAIRSLQRQSGDMQGKTASAILEKSREMEMNLTRMIEKLESSADYIRKTVQHYQRLDEELKRAIQAAAQVAAGAASQGQKIQQAGSAAAAGAAAAQGGHSEVGALASQIVDSVMNIWSPMTRR